MKTKSLIFTALLFTVIGLASCKKSTTTPTSSNSTFVATLNGASETPGTGSAATGTATFTYNPSTYILSGTVSFSGVTATAAHIHKGAVGTAGAVVFTLGTALPTSPISFSSVLDANELADLMANLYYVNVHSASFPGGEIRGQLLKQ